MKIVTIAHNTFRESVRDRVLYNLAVYALLLITVSAAVSRIARGDEGRIVVDFGLTAMVVFGVSMAVFLGVGLVAREIERGTVSIVLAKPVDRHEFIAGRYLGVCLTLLVNLAAMAAAVAAARLLVAGPGDRAITGLLSAAWLIYLETAIVAGVALLFSSFSSTGLSALLTVVVFLIGRWSADLKSYAEAGGIAARIVYRLIPSLAGFDYIGSAASSVAVPTPAVAAGTGYAAAYIAALLVATVTIFERRDFN